MKRPWPALFLVGLAVRSDAFGGTKRSRTIARSWSGTDAPLKSAVFDRGWDENHERSSEVEVVDGCPLTADEEFIRLRNEIRNPTNSELNKKYASIIPLTVHILRREYGTRPTWWGDLTASEARLLYWRLLPTVMLLEEEFICLPLKDRAYIASMARYAAKLYARERSMVPERAAAAVYDGTRYALKTGRWSPTGMSVEEIWLKYEREVKEELSADAVTEDELYRRLYQRILRKSCSTNPFIDAVCSTNPSAMKGKGGSLPGVAVEGRDKPVWQLRPERALAAVRHALRGVDPSPLAECGAREQGQRVVDLLRLERVKQEMGARLGPRLEMWVTGANARLLDLLRQIDAKEKHTKTALRAEGRQIKEAQDENSAAANK